MVVAHGSLRVFSANSDPCTVCCIRLLYTHMVSIKKKIQYLIKILNIYKKKKFFHNIDTREPQLLTNEYITSIRHFLSCILSIKVFLQCVCF